MPVKAQPWDKDDDVDIRVTVRDVDDVLVDPDTLTLTILCPDDVELSLAKTDMERESTGVYLYTYRVANGWGIYRGTWHAAGDDYSIVQQFRFHVRKSAEEDT